MLHLVFERALVYLAIIDASKKWILAVGRIVNGIIENRFFCDLIHPILWVGLSPGFAQQCLQVRCHIESNYYNFIHRMMICHRLSSRN